MHNAKLSLSPQWVLAFYILGTNLIWPMATDADRGATQRGRIKDRLGRSIRPRVRYFIQDGHIPVTGFIFKRSLFGFVIGVRILAWQPGPPNLGNIDFLALDFNIVRHCESGRVLAFPLPVRMSRPRLKEPPVGFGQVLHGVAHSGRMMFTQPRPV